jgi:predicted regulator of Ras-like GTPase activity (Roadblock/LC7/MglB family)
MPTIRELVAAIAQREGVEAAIVLGRDGLLIDGRAGAGLDAERLAALVPAVAAAAEELSADARRGSLITAVLEYEHGLALVCSLTADAHLLVLVHPTANVGSLLFELRRHRGSIAAIV